MYYSTFLCAWPALFFISPGIAPPIHTKHENLPLFGRILRMWVESLYQHCSCLYKFVFIFLVEGIMNYVAFGRRVRQLRRSLHWTQAQLAQTCGISLSFLGHIERGSRKASLQTLMDLCGVLGINPDHLLEDSLDTAAESADGTESAERVAGPSVFRAVPDEDAQSDVSPDRSDPVPEDGGACVGYAADGDSPDEAVDSSSWAYDFGPPAHAEHTLRQHVAFVDLWAAEAEHPTPEDASDCPEDA